MALAAQLVRHGGALALLPSHRRLCRRTLLQVVSILLAVLRQCHRGRPLQQRKPVRLVVLPAMSDNC